MGPAFQTFAKSTHSIRYTGNGRDRTNARHIKRDPKNATVTVAFSRFCFDRGRGTAGRSSRISTTLPSGEDAGLDFLSIKIQPHRCWTGMPMLILL
jgi:hypothetical protein